MIETKFKQTELGPIPEDLGCHPNIKMFVFW